MMTFSIGNIFLQKYAILLKNTVTPLRDDDKASRGYFLSYIYQIQHLLRRLYR